MTTVSMMDFLMGSKKHRSLMSVLLGNFKLNDPPVGVHAVPVIHRLGAVIKRANEGKPIDRVALADCVFHSSLLNQAAVRVPVLVADRTTGVTDFLAVVRGPLDDVGREKVGVLARGSAIAPSKREALGRRLQVREERFERLDRRAEAADAGAPSGVRRRTSRRRARPRRAAPPHATPFRDRNCRSGTGRRASRGSATGRPWGRR